MPIESGFVGAGLSLDAWGGGDPLAYLNADQRTGPSPNGKPNFTIDRAGLQMTGFHTGPGGVLVPEPGWGGVPGQAFTVSYGFRSTAPAEMPEDAGGFTRFTAEQIDQAELALTAWSDVANIHFVRVGSGDTGEGAYTNDASILLANYSTGVEGAAAFGNYPGVTDFASESGDVWVNSTISYNAHPALGNRGPLVLVHELGHAIGLTHPGAYDADADTVITYDHDAEYYEDSTQYTVMSYFSETETGASYGGRYAAAPQLDDIRAAQIEYGANMTTRTGDTTYGFNSTADRPWFSATSQNTKVIFAVWDAGGTDTFDFSGYSNNQLIDLRQGFFSNVGGLTGNVAIAQGVDIENAKGGSGADVIHGNALANVITGGAGADTIDGGSGGVDHLDGGSGVDLLSFGGATAGVSLNLGAETVSTGAVFISFERYLGSDFGDTITGSSLADVIGGGAGNDSIAGGGDADSIDGGSGANYLRGEDGNDVITGGGDFDDINGNKGADLAHGGAGDDWVVGGQDNDQLFGDDGGDIVYGNLGDDTDDGGAGADLIRGGQGNDVLTGGTGNDWLSGDRGDDTITGGAGADTFHGSQDAGIDRILDFNYAEGDRVVFDAGTTYTVAQQGADVVIAMGPGNAMILVNVQLSSLPSGWILGA